MYFCLPLSVGFREKHHSPGSFFTLHPWRIDLPSGDKMVTYCFLNTKVQFESKMGPTTIGVLVNMGMMYPVLGKSYVNGGIGSMTFAADDATCPFALPALILVALVSSGPYGALGAIYRCVAPESKISVCCYRRLFSFSSDGLGLYVWRVGLQLKLASYLKFYLR